MVKNRTLTSEYCSKSYIKESKTATFQGKTITVTHVTPRLAPDEHAKRKKDIEHQLYDVFVKYVQPEKKAG